MDQDASGADPNTDVSKHPPYVVFSTLITFADRLKETVVPTQIDNNVMSKVGGGARGLLIATLKQFGWATGDKNAPTEAFKEFIFADDNTRKQKIRDLLKKVYPKAFADDVDLRAITVGALEEKVAPNAKNDTLRKCFKFFTDACEYADIELGEFAKKKHGGTRTRKSGKPRGKRSAQQATEVELPEEQKPAPDDRYVKIPVPLTHLRTWYVVVEKEHTPADVARFAQIIQIVLSSDEATS